MIAGQGDDVTSPAATSHLRVLDGCDEREHFAQGGHVLSGIRRRAVRAVHQVHARSGERAAGLANALNGAQVIRRRP